MARLPSLMISVLVWSACLIIVDASSCGGTFKSNYGEITSMNYPSNYESNLLCEWMIEGATGSRLVIGFKDFSLESQSDCNKDYIQIRHGTVTTSKYCGGKIPDRVISQSQNATIVFVTNRSSNQRGFRLYWKVLTEPVLMASPVPWESATAECEWNGGKLMEPDSDYVDTYEERIIELMGANNISEMWVRKYFTPWVFLKGCTLRTYVHPKKTYTVKNNQQKICQNLCSSYNYFGLKKDICVCLNDVFSAYDSYDSCHVHCDGNNEELCGGEYAYTVYKNNLCYISSESWNGTLNQDILGFPCVFWNLTSFKNSKFLDGSATDAKNNCRDPNGSGQPWCVNRQGQKLICDVFECLDMTAKQNGSSECFAIRIDMQGTTVPQRFTGQQMPCNTKLTGIYLYRSEFTKMQIHQISGTWTYVRNFVEQYSYWFLFSTVYNYNYAAGYHWTGVSRNTSTLRPLAAPSECFKLQWHEQRLEEKTDTCDLKLPFICQKVPVNCGQSFIQTESKLNFTIESGSYDMNCEWKIEGYDSTLVRIDISFDIEECPNCECDSLKIYDAATVIGLPKETLCGKRQVTFNSTQKAITLTYSSDRSVEKTGFQAQWSFVSVPSHSTTTTPSESTTKSRTGSDDVSPSTFSVSLPSQSTTSTAVGSTIKSKTGSEDVSPNTVSAGLIGGIVAAVVVITASVIVCVVVIRRRKPRKKCEEANNCATEMVTSNNETESSGDIYSVSAKAKIRKGMDSVEYAVVNKRQINKKVSSTQNIPIDSGRNSNIAEKRSVDDKGHKYLHHGYDRVEKVPGEANEDDEYNRLNEIMEPEFVKKTDNVYNHVQGIDNDIYDHTADDSDTHDRRASYSHIRGPFPSSEQRHGAKNNISDVFDHTTDDLETPDRRDLYSHVRGSTDHRNETET